MIKPKVWLVQNGHMPEGYQNARGRISATNKALITEAVLAGAQVEGFALQASTGPSEAATVEKVKPTTGEKVIADVNYRYSEEDYVARENVTGVLRVMREACRHCGCSLVGCWCTNPEIVALDGSGSVSVTIERK